MNDDRAAIMGSYFRLRNRAGYNDFSNYAAVYAGRLDILLKAINSFLSNWTIEQFSTKLQKVKYERKWLT